MPDYPWRLLIQGPLPPPLALAIDEAIALCCGDHGGRATLRFYRWDRPAISLGRFQAVDRAVRSDRCRAEGIPLLRRITGGRAVWHHQELTYSVVSPLPSALFSPHLQEAVATIGRGLIRGLQRVGLRAQAPPPSAAHAQPTRQPRATTSRRSPYCFASASWYEITCREKKVIGSAQRRWRDRLLQQGSILLHHEPEAIGRWLMVDDADLQRAAGLATLLPDRSDFLDANRLARRLAESMADCWGVLLCEGGLTARETALAARLAEEKYGRPEWTQRAEAPATDSVPRARSLS